MKASKWLRIVIVESNDSINKLEVGNVFLEGDRIISQRETKRIGNFITYYKVTNNNNKGLVSYVPITEKLEEG